MIPLLYQDAYLVICDKPAGVLSESPGLPDMIREQEGFPVFPVHRLDRTTGGVCVLARTTAVCAEMQCIFQRNCILKEYLAVISGVPETDSGSFFDLLYHDRRTNKTFIVKNHRKGVKEAFCEWSVLQSIALPEGKISLVRVRLHSGRTHQIRIQFASRKMPLVGDHRYGSRIKSSIPALWSARISFPHPISDNKLIDLSSAPPACFPWICFSTYNQAPQSGA